MNKQLNFTDMEYSNRRRTTKREEFLKKLDQILLWTKWVDIVRPYYPTGKRGRPPREIEVMLRMLLLQLWFNLSDEAVEDAIYDSYAMKSFLSLDFDEAKQVPDATTLCKFRKRLNEHHLQYVVDGVARRYEIYRQHGTFRRHYNDSISWKEERKLENRKASVRCKVEYVFHIVKDIFHWRKTRYRGIEKNLNYAYLAFASANLYMLSCFA